VCCGRVTSDAEAERGLLTRVSLTWLACSWYSSALIRSIGSGLADIVACGSELWASTLAEQSVWQLNLSNLLGQALTHSLKLPGDQQVPSRAGGDGLGVIGLCKESQLGEKRLACREQGVLEAVLVTGEWDPFELGTWY
jgi:hypothetical protein